MFPFWRRPVDLEAECRIPSSLAFTLLLGVRARAERVRVEFASGDVDFIGATIGPNYFPGQLRGEGLRSALTDAAHSFFPRGEGQKVCFFLRGAGRRFQTSMVLVQLDETEIILDILEPRSVPFGVAESALGRMLELIDSWDDEEPQVCVARSEE